MRHAAATESHPDDGLAVRCPRALVLREGGLHAVPTARQRPLQDEHVLESGVHALSMGAER